MLTTNRNTQSGFIDDSAFPPSAVNQTPNLASITHVPPTSRELSRFLEYRQAKETGFELSISSREAAAYVGLNRKEVEAMARKGWIPAHATPDVRRKIWRFYASELDAWLFATISSSGDMPSLNGKETIQ
jgi:excisionase family DNA binding protein